LRLQENPPKKKKQTGICEQLFEKSLFAESLTRRAGWESQQDQAARAEKKKIFDALALASILHNSALESASKVVFTL
jgi:hypothetical protein